ISSVKKGGGKMIPGEKIFKLYDTYGFPIDFARDIAMDAGLRIDEDSFHAAMEAQRNRSKAVTMKGEAAVAIEAFGKGIIGIGKSEFVGYETLQVHTFIKGILSAETLQKGEEGDIILDKTPFYGESGGQSGDTGIIKSAGALLNVLDTKKTASDHLLHHIKFEKGTIKTGEEVACSVDEETRKSTMRNHTATHLLHKALKMVLGDHVKQSGSVVDPERLRFDFTHFTAVQPDEVRKIEDIVNEKILGDLLVRTDIMGVDEAVKTGAVALFDEKYGETVRVVSAGDFSKELCGGTHCKATGEIGPFVIVSEGSVASGIRRVEALTGKNALDYFRQKKAEIEGIKGSLKTENPSGKIEKMINEMKGMEKEIQRLKTGSAKDTISDALNEAFDLGGIKLVTLRQDGLNPNELRLLADNVRDRLGSGIIVLTSVTDGQAAIVGAVTKDLIDKYHAGDIVKNISKTAGGKGGGKPDMAQGGTRDIEKLNTALASVYDIVKNSAIS
ncbi:MAG: alanine--tRNA ligase, partial [Nitrospirales bacterium]